MAALAWKFYNSAKKYLMNGTIDLDGDNFRMTLHTTATNVTDATLSSKGSLGSEVTEANGYSSSGKQLSGVTWTAGASASEFRFDATALIWTASGGTIASVKLAAIWASGGQLLCYASLSSGAFDITDGNTLTVTPSANGIFELN